MFNRYLDIHLEVAHALQLHQPIVALASTSISHDMPYPKNMTTALQVEQEIRNYGAILATIAIINGRIKIGLTLNQ